MNAQRARGPRIEVIGGQREYLAARFSTKVAVGLHREIGAVIAASAARGIPVPPRLVQHLAEHDVDVETTYAAYVDDPLNHYVQLFAAQAQTVAPAASPMTEREQAIVVARRLNEAMARMRARR